LTAGPAATNLVRWGTQNDLSGGHTIVGERGRTRWEGAFAQGQGLRGKTPDEVMAIYQKQDNAYCSRRPRACEAGLQCKVGKRLDGDAVVDGSDCGGPAGRRAPSPAAPAPRAVRTETLRLGHGGFHQPGRPRSAANEQRRHFPGADAVPPLGRAAQPLARSCRTADSGRQLGTFYREAAAAREGMPLAGQLPLGGGLSLPPYSRTPELLEDISQSSSKRC